MKFMKLVIFLLGCAVAIPAYSQTSGISGTNILNGDPVNLVFADTKATVILFLSSVCPCSNSHVSELKSLHKEFDQFSFIGVHSNGNEGKETTTAYFKTAALPFPIIHDRDAKIADRFLASKTPHAVVLLADGTVAYRGGVSSSKNVEKAETLHLREALTNLRNGERIQDPNVRTLGCAISRGPDVW
ncbi:MAG: redoxin domain-containing protein [Proteobacteria bacterium]|nr:MAG: redoxin domain-containing protein [Pseudomonadota bacterium]